MPIPPIPSDVHELLAGPWRVWVLPYGARLVQIWHRSTPLLLGFKDSSSYRSDRMSMGAVCGRYGNRIENARLERDGIEYALTANEGAQCLHGGQPGFGDQTWTLDKVASDCITLTLTSPDGDQGFPGQCQARVTYRVSPQGISCALSASVDKPCPINLIQHNYWNLGADAGNHRLWIPATQTQDTDSRNLPKPPRDVTAADDFSSMRPIGHMNFDRNYCVPGQGIRPVARLAGPYGELQVHSDQPHIQLYCAAGLKPTTAPLGVMHNPGAGVCLETQQMPNGPAMGQDVWIEPGQRYAHHIRWEFTPA